MSDTVEPITPANPGTGSPVRRALAWGAAAAGIGALAWFSIALAIPFMRARSAVHSVAAGRISMERAVENLGGPVKAAGLIGMYLPRAWRAENRSQAASILGCCGPSGVLSLSEALADSNDRVRRSAADALARIGAEAGGAVGALEKALDDAAPDVRRAAAEALGRIGPEARGATAALIRVAGLDNPDVGMAAVEALGLIGPDASPAVPALRSLLGRSSGDLRIAAAVALCRIGVGGREVLAPLVEALTNGDWETRAEAARTLGRLGPLARQAVPALEKAGRDDNLREVRAAAADALKRIRGR